MSELRPILIVEDSDEDFEAIMWAWKKGKLCAPVVRSKDGEDALDRVFRRGAYVHSDPRRIPALVMLDLNLPRTHGRAVLAAIKRDADLKTTPVVILTTSSNPRDVEVCYREGANSYIVKPGQMNRLLEILQRIEGYWMDVVRLPEPGGTHAG
jgi:CheY-like chemotaxis protein